MQKIIEALVGFHREMKPPKKDKKGGFNNWYASFDSVCAAIVEPLANNGLSVTQDIQYIDDKTWMVSTLMHISGESIQSKVPMVIEKQGNHGMASAITYSKRYGLALLLVIPSDEDDDAEAAEHGNNTVQKSSNSEPYFPTDRQMDLIVSLGKSNSQMASAICNHYKVKDISELADKKMLQADIDGVIASLRGKK